MDFTPRFSIIIPIFNRPEEMEELLHSLSLQTIKNFEVIVVEDGSSLPCSHVVEQYKDKLDIHYFSKNNSGPGDSRNYGVTKTSSDYFIFFDSDCLIPANYFEQLTKRQATQHIDCFGGPDKAHESFTPIQKAISYSMTSLLTTGGMRGGSEQMIKFHPRSFNMGFSRKVFDFTQGFSKMRFGEDVDFSLRVEASGMDCMLIPECYVYHKRRTDFWKFYKQIFNSGIARINLYLKHPSSLKLTHFFPAAFVVGSLGALLVLVCGYNIPFGMLVFYCVMLWIDAGIKNKSALVGWLSVLATWVQMYAYGLGFMSSFWNRLILKKQEFSAFDENFYK